MTVLSSSVTSIFSARSQDGAVARDQPAARELSPERRRSKVVSQTTSNPTRLPSLERDSTTHATTTEAKSISIRRGQTGNHRFNEEDSSLLVYTRHLAVYLTLVASPVSKVTSNNSCTQNRYIQAEIQYLTWDEHLDQTGNLSLVDLQSGDWGEMGGLEHLLFSTGGLLLKQQTTLLLLRAYMA